MATTPPPPSHLHTPPTPLHGARHDYEPYSPRRSTRVAGQRKNYSLHQPSFASTPGSSERVPPSPGRSLAKPSLHRTSSQTFSPPSSPDRRVPSQAMKDTPLRRVTNTPRKSRSALALDSDSDHALGLPVPSSSRGIDSRTMLPTPAKTPRKKQIDTQPGSAARILFPNRPVTIEDAMPSPKKARKGKKFAGFTLQSFTENCEEEDASSSKIEIYTDSKERIPVLDEDEENPFIGKRAGKQRANTSASFLRRRRPDARSLEMERASRNDEGIVYVFRGKKIFRRFDDTLGDEEEELNDLSEEDTRRKAGVSTQRRFTRSSIKPRLLFPPKEQEQAAIDAAEEEALTDIEVPLPPRTGNKRLMDASLFTTPSALTPPVQHQFNPDTPSASPRATRSSARRDLLDASEEPVLLPLIDQEGPSASSSGETLPIPTTRGKKPSPFASWRRAKPSQAAPSKGTKREGSPLEQGDGKRVRAETSTNGV